ncbi:uncharacterized protein LOC128254860 [Drosophila gunungcola]|uniref:Uncharacterized protein n=1 Tax=Drosophila gunungcola TaxID=103775 RepID=A0A9P9YKL0_9MUSC|nr:uncharacterized protein LOC128254860 [Drosophila gunungcola]KAI8038740.1 hypothetical protein M5D96_008648 [Drosophila gunungcola]
MLLLLNGKTINLDQHFIECWKLSLLRNFDLFSLLSAISLTATKMAAIPQGAFAACKIREQFNEREMIVARLRSAASDKGSVDNGNSLTQHEYSPNKYNDKLMNSIWGLYNRYSPHNVKKNEYAPTK